MQCVWQRDFSKEFTPLRGRHRTGMLYSSHIYSVLHVYIYRTDGGPVMVFVVKKEKIIKNNNNKYTRIIHNKMYIVVCIKYTCPYVL